MTLVIALAREIGLVSEGHPGWAFRRCTRPGTGPSRTSGLRNSSWPGGDWDTSLPSHPRSRHQLSRPSLTSVRHRRRTRPAARNHPSLRRLRRGAVGHRPCRARRQDHLESSHPGGGPSGGDSRPSSPRLNSSVSLGGTGGSPMAFALVSAEEPDLAAAAAATLPATTTTATFGSDLTVLVSGSPTAQVNTLLGRLRGSRKQRQRQPLAVQPGQRSAGPRRRIVCCRTAVLAGRHRRWTAAATAGIPDHRRRSPLRRGHRDSRSVRPAQSRRPCTASADLLGSITQTAWPATDRTHGGAITAEQRHHPDRSAQSRLPAVGCHRAVGRHHDQPEPAQK